VPVRVRVPDRAPVRAPLPLANQLCHHRRRRRRRKRSTWDSCQEKEWMGRVHMLRKWNSVLTGSLLV